MAPLLLLLLTLLLSSLLLFIISSITNTTKNNTTKNHPPLPPCPKGWPILGNLLQLGHKPHHTLHTLSKSYGPLFRLRFGSVNVVVASSAAIASAVLRSLDSNFSNRPPNSGAEHIAYNYQDLVFAPYGPRWRNLRRLCALHLFSTRALEDFRRVREEEVALLAGVLEKAREECRECRKAVNSCATNALARATVGRRVFMEAEEGEAGEFKEMVVELMRLAGVFNVGDFVPWLRPLDVQGVVRKMKKLHKRYDEFFDGIIKEHRRVAGGDGGGGAAAGDLLSVMLGWEDEEGGGKLSDTDIKALLLNLFTAGTDTTASTVEWALAELIRHPDILAQAQTELDSIIGQSRLRSESDLHKLPSCKPSSKETFRYTSLDTSLPPPNSLETLSEASWISNNQVRYALC
ncbi:hypothetical protein J5N97_015858 [Dioscorea zingiberensis]|uniref:Uncharacterized protein n=1 Tax=Dioscorea zingiberensis TaxID=325984 RepID=A0A9D5HF29_9LILI|nr:hypothetical protein J5N97_015858 [Dioscorea zingiberensis]